MLMRKAIKKMSQDSFFKLLVIFLFCQAKIQAKKYKQYIEEAKREIKNRQQYNIEYWKREIKQSPQYIEEYKREIEQHKQLIEG